MHWPITITQDKCAVDIVQNIVPNDLRWHALRQIGFMVPETGPWNRYGFYWRWGCTKVTDYHLMRCYGPPLYISIIDEVVI